LKCTEEQLVEALTGRSHPLHQKMLAFELERLRLLDEQIAKLNSLMAQAMKPHQDAVIRLAEVGRVESRHHGFPCFPCSVISMACSSRGKCWMNRHATQLNAPHPPRNAYSERLSLSALARFITQGAGAINRSALANQDPTLSWGDCVPAKDTASPFIQMAAPGSLSRFSP
jgi:hypothetical protein